MGAIEDDTEKRGGTGVPQDAAAPPERDAVTGAQPGALKNRLGRKRRANRGEKAMVPDATFESYYGKPILNEPTWSALDIAGYLFMGGLAGGSSIIAAGAEFTDRPTMARNSKVMALGAITASLVALVHDLGRPARFLNMLRVFKPSSPMSVGSWLLSVYGPQAGVAAVTAVSGKFVGLGRVATVGAAVTGPAVAGYTAALMSDTAVPAWHDGHRNLPFVFVGSATMAAGGFAMAASPLAEAGPARRAVLLGAAVETVAQELMEREMGLASETLHKGTAGKLTTLSRIFTATAVLTSMAAAPRSRFAALVGGAAALAGSACTRFAIFHAGVASSKDPKYVVVPQRERVDARREHAAR
ncbi:NrfD/PsrC family molybdoenzyme membrane anchor subunit [Rhodococcus sp. NPDC078407]|uniref:NrfD/PsrC family molybdoenzyme membrane anchor subunit n=1 Tax=Rhodococcus sp. NPDC078407 TaxID=3364509 RepID=UPI0037CC0303